MVTAGSGGGARTLGLGCGDRGRRYISSSHVFRVVGHVYPAKNTYEVHAVPGSEWVAGIGCRLDLTGLSAAQPLMLFGGVIHSISCLGRRCHDLAKLATLLVLCSSLLPGLTIFALPESRRIRTTLNLFGAVTKLALVAWMVWDIYQGHQFETRLQFLPNLDFTLQMGPLSVLFVTLSALLWLVTTIYAIGYLEGSPHRSRFFGFFSLCVTATAGVAMAGICSHFCFLRNVDTRDLPLVVHRGQSGPSAGYTYLRYTLPGGVLHIGTVWLYTVTGTGVSSRGFCRL